MLISLINFGLQEFKQIKPLKAMILNRIGDFSLLMGIMLIFVNYKAVDYATVASLTFQR
jgi:NADH:ubiquinone oxidoreductase subunit 5 (subunit L)/multisubunit Na+/H+ antiporter MnhA subunit